MIKDDSVYLKHIFDAANRIVIYVGNMNREDFLRNELVQDGVIRQIEIIGEAVNRLSQTIREKYVKIPWKDIVGMRNKLIHDYMGVDLDAVWDSAEKDIPLLKTKIEEIIRGNQK